ncbi:MAG: trehalose-6-phosphate synthase [Pseudonocardiales bacterium]|nr:trehalose-6-phosphate synthase [Pseudonocardiales bacterium]
MVILSDRGPVRFTNQSSQLVPERQSSSVTALLHGIAGMLTSPVTWVTTSTSTADAQAMRRGLFRDLAARFGYSPEVVLIHEQEYKRYYDDAGVRIIWSAWHGIEDEIPVRYDSESPLTSLTSYTQVNRQLSSRIAQVAAKGAVVAVQDYQFMLAPMIIRSLRPDARIVHFSHTPFPNSESVTKLPSVIIKRLVTGMLGADLLGFQCARWAHRFLQCCLQLGLDVDQRHGQVRYDGRRVWVRCYPVPVDVLSLTGRSTAPKADRWEGRTKAEDRRRSIVRVDRLDPAKNALRGFEAYALLLHRHPALARDLRFVACLVPSRERLPEYQRYARNVWQVVDDVNRQHPGSITVHYGNDQDRALGIMRGYDVLLVNPVTDGMNLVAQEGPIVNTRDGVVVLSLGAGAADLVSGAVILDRPRDVKATADALEVALSLSPAERRDRANRMRAAISQLSPTTWLDLQLTDALAVTSGSAPSCPPPHPAKKTTIL